MMKMKSNIKSYSELMKLQTFEERFRYLQLNGVVGFTEETPDDRRARQMLYSSAKWKRFRRDIIIRDQGCDLGMPGYDIDAYANIHHINPITVEDILYERACVYDPENVITVTHNTHMAIHYSDESILVTAPVERTPYDTCPWKLNKKEAIR